MNSRTRFRSADARAPHGGGFGRVRRPFARSWWLMGWLCVTLLGAQAVGRLHGIAHADWHGTVRPIHAQSIDTSPAAAHDCLLFDAGALASGLVGAAQALPAVVRAPRARPTVAAPSPDLPARLAFRSQAPPAIHRTV
ncbi:MAG: hypothetical protein QM766_08465 [Burkholderiaceae bacterium]